jgi:hypothetical protein
VKVAVDAKRKYCEQVHNEDYQSAKPDHCCKRLAVMMATRRWTIQDADAQRSDARKVFV